jgi:hypothetical protein
MTLREKYTSFSKEEKKMFNKLSKNQLKNLHKIGYFKKFLTYYLEYKTFRK